VDMGGGTLASTSNMALWVVLLPFPATEIHTYVLMISKKIHIMSVDYAWKWRHNCDQEINHVQPDSKPSSLLIS
jgi:hypothetical protein